MKLTDFQIENGVLTPKVLINPSQENAGVLRNMETLQYIQDRVAYCNNQQKISPDGAAISVSNNVALVWFLQNNSVITILSEDTTGNIDINNRAIRNAIFDFLIKGGVILESKSKVNAILDQLGQNSYLTKEGLLYINQPNYHSRLLNLTNRDS